MGTKRDYMYMLLLLLVVVLGSCVMEDSRLITPKERSKFEEVVHKATLKANNVQFLCKPDLIQAEIETAPVEEVIVEEEIIESGADFQSSEQAEYNEEVAEDPYSPGLIYLGEFEITAYEWTGNPCANGDYPTEGYTIACNSLPIGTTVYIDGVGYRVVEDRGAAYHGDNWLDLYLGDVSACYSWGVQYLDVYVVE